MQCNFMPWLSNAAKWEDIKKKKKKKGDRKAETREGEQESRLNKGEKSQIKCGK